LSVDETGQRRAPSHPTVSVIMPVYNLESVLPYAVESVLNQTMPDFELVIVDDASTDETSRIAEYYRVLDSRVRVLRNDTNSRQGPIEWEPRNNGLQVARGEFIAYLDGDNAWHPQMLGCLTEALASRAQAQLGYCRSRNFHSPSDVDSVIAADSREAVARGHDWVVFAQQRLNPAELGRSQYVDTNEMVHRASVFGRLGSLWNTVHPRREWVSQHQGKRRPYRRHNDLDLVERIIHAYGVGAVHQVPTVLVDFYYPSSPRRPKAALDFLGSVPQTEMVAS
jgi:glycosyl transferase family 2